MAQLVVAAAGAVGGFLIGGPSGAVAGFALGYSLMAGKGAPARGGSALQDLRVTGTQYGQSIPWALGSPRMAGQIWWASNKRAISHSQSAGKGGGQTTTSFTYEVDLLIGLTDGQIGWVSRVWLNGKLTYNVINASATQSTIDASITSEAWNRISIYTGSTSQLPDPTYEAAVGTVNAPGYRGRSAVFIEGLKLGASGQIPNLTFEICTGAMTNGTVVLLMNLDGNLNDASATAGSFAADGTSFTATGAKFSQSLDVGGNAGSQGGGNVVYSVTPKNEWDVNVGDFTIEGWMLFKDAPTRPKTLIQIQESGATTTAYGIIADGIGTEGLRFFYPITFNTSTFLTAGPALDSSAIGTWFHCAATREGNLYRFFVNGQLGSQVTQTYRRPSGPHQIFIGNSMRAFYDAHYGLIDGIRVITGKALYTASFTPPTEPPGALTTMGTITPLSLQSAVSAICTRAGLQLSQIDTTALASITRPVRALAVAQVGPLRSVLEQLQTAYQFEAVLSDKLYFRPRGAASVATIPYTDLGATGGGASQSQPLPLTIASDLELPPQVAVQYLNDLADQQSATEVSDRLIAGQAALSTVSLGLSLQPTEAKSVADAIVADQLASLVTTSLHLTLQYANLEPSDVVQVNDAAGNTHRLRLVKRDDAHGVLSFDAIADDAQAIVSGGTTSSAYTATSDVSSLANTTLYALDIPLLRDADDTPGYYVAATGTTTYWPGCVVMSSNDGAAYAQAAAVEESAVMGNATTTLGNWTGGIVFDEINTLTVTVGNGQLSSATRDALLADRTLNTLLVGSEVIRFATATLVTASPNVYTLRQLLRGQQGTGWAMGGHGATERVALLAMRGLRRVSQKSTDVNQLRWLKGVTNGKTVGATLAQTFTNTGVSAKPWAPVDLRATRDVTGNLVMAWKRCTRYGVTFAGVAGISVPLGELLERYDLEIWDSSYTTRKRVFSGLTSPSAPYAYAQQYVDSNGGIPTIYCRVYQLADDGSRGYPLQASATAGLMPVSLNPVLLAASSSGWLAYSARRESSGAVGVINDVVVTTYWKSSTAAGPYTKVLETDSRTSSAQFGWFNSQGNPAQFGGNALSIAFVNDGGRTTSNLFTVLPLDLSSAPRGVTTSPAFYAPRCISADSTRFILMGEHNNVYTSTDGAAWSLLGVMSGTLFPYFVGSFDFVGNTLRRVGTRWFLMFNISAGGANNDRLFYSDDADAVTGWTAVTGITTGNNIAPGSQVVYDGTLHYTTTFNVAAGTTTIYSSSDGGATWSAQITCSAITGFETSTSGTNAPFIWQLQVTGTTGSDKVRAYMLNGVVYEKTVGVPGWTAKAHGLVNPQQAVFFGADMVAQDNTAKYTPELLSISYQTGGVFSPVSGF